MFYFFGNTCIVYTFIKRYTHFVILRTYCTLLQIKLRISVQCIIFHLLKVIHSMNVWNFGHIVHALKFIPRTNVLFFGQTVHSLKAIFGITVFLFGHIAQLLKTIPRINVIFLAISKTVIKLFCIVSLSDCFVKFVTKRFSLNFLFEFSFLYIIKSVWSILKVCKRF